MDIWTAADGGPSAEFYRELAEAHGVAWVSPNVVTRAEHAMLALMALRPADRGPLWRCPRCGGPGLCPDLAATLAYRKCGYAELSPNGAWRHE